MNYTFCKTCENEFDIDEIGDDNSCPHCGSSYDWLSNDDNDEDESNIDDFLTNDEDWN